MNFHIRLYFFLFLFIILVSTPVNATQLTDTVVKIFVTANNIDYYRPWQSRGTKSSSGSGSIIEGNKILTNAHVVTDHTFIQVKKNSSPKKYTAQVEVIGHDCDLAILTVDDPTFFEGITPLKFGELSKLKDTVTVLGYPQGGDKLSITEGVVSRIELTSYSQSSRKLLTVQIDAAINPGNSGGPVLLNDKLIGVAMQVLPSGQNIGYMIPIPIIEHFFNDLDDGKYDGFPILGIDFNTTENSTLRKYYHLDNEKGGVLITKILPFSPAEGHLQEGDIILSVNNIHIGEDGTFIFRDDERLFMPYLITKEQIGKKIDFKIMREGKISNLSLNLIPFIHLIPYPHYFKEPPYYIYGGLIFTVLSVDLLRAWGNHWWEKAPLDFNHYLIGSGRLNKEQRKEIVVLLNVLADDINIGYHSYGNEIIAEVNGKSFNSFSEFVLLLNSVKNNEDYTIIETEQKILMILNNENIDTINFKIIKRNNIPFPYSENVKEWLDKGEANP